jgi:hypothetical protein
VVVREDGPAVSVAWAAGMSATDHFVTSTSAPALFAVPPSVAPDGRLSFDPARDAFGLADVAVTAVGNDRAGAAHTFRITVEPVNDPPSFTGGGDVTVGEDSGVHAVAWATAISPGPPNEGGQHVHFTVTSDDPSLFAAGGAPAVADSGELSFTPALGASGSTTVKVTAVDDGGTTNGGDDRTQQTFIIVVLARNDAPSVSGIGDLSVPEDAPAQTIQWVTSVSPGPSDESGQHVTLGLASDHPELFAVQPALTQSGTLTYTPAADAFGIAHVTVTAKDDGGTANGGVDTSSKTFTITLRPVNDAPTFVPGGNVTVLENAGAQTLTWASGVGAGPSNEAGQVVSFSTSNDDASLFAAAGQPSVAADGTLTFTPEFAAGGTATVTVTEHDDGGTADGGTDTGPTASFTITVTAVNQQPTFTAGGAQTSAEDTPVSGVQWATAITAGANEGSQTLSFTVTNDDNALFSVQPSIDAAGRLSYTPAPDRNGSATVSVTLHDNGGTANGGVDTSTTATFTLTVTPVNDAPSFNSGGSVTVLEDSAAYSGAWASSISPGPGEGGQTVSFTVTNDGNSLFSVQPSIDASGTLRFTPAPNAYGAATVTVVATDDGGVAGGGVDTASPQTFTLTITPVNDAPSFLPGGNVTALEDAGAQDVAWATATSPGPNESSQQVTFLVTNTNNALFGTQPAIDGTTGRLTFTSAPDANGSATVTVRAADDGGTANGGVDTSAPVTFTLTVTAVNDAPSLTAGSAQTAPENGGTQTVPAWATAVSAGPADEAAQTVTFTVTTSNDPLFATLPAVSSTGTLTYTPATNAYGTATVTVTPHDNGGTADGGIDTGAPVSFSITVLRPPVAVNDTYSGTILTEIAGNVLDNDSDPDGQIANDTVSLASSPSHGLVSLQSDGSFIYTPNLLYTGTDSFTYTVASAGGSSTGLVSLTIGGANVDTKVMASANGTGTAPYALGSGTFTPTASALYLVFVGHVAAAGETPTLTPSGDLTVNGGPIVTATTTSTAKAGAVMYGWVWQVTAQGASPSSLAVSFLNSNLKKTNADVIEVVQVNSSQFPPYVGAGTSVPAASAVVSGRAVTAQLASPSSTHSEVSFVYVDGDTAGDPGWATPGMSTFASSVRHQPNGTDGFGALVGYAPNALSSATTGKIPAPDGTSYIAISFELLP